MDISKEKISEQIDIRLNNVPHLINQEKKFKEKHLKLIEEIGALWYFDELAGEWYFSNTNSYEEIDVRYLDFYHSKKGYASKERKKLLDEIGQKCLELDAQFIDNYDDFGPNTINHIKKYLNLLTEHQLLASSINRWKYAPIWKDIHGVNRVYEGLQTLKLFQEAKRSYFSGLDKVTDIHELLSYSWDFLGSGLTEYSILILEELKSYFVEIQNKFDAYKLNDAPKPQFILTPFDSLSDDVTHIGVSVSRYTLSTNLCLAKCFTKLNRIEESKNLYKENVSFWKDAEIVSPILNPVERHRRIFYKSGLSRAIESAIEWYKLCDSSEEKEEVLKIINKLVFISKTQEGGSIENNEDSLREVLLLSYALLRDVYNQAE